MIKVNRKVSVIAILLVFSCLLFSGCGLFFNPSKYVKASFDAMYKGDFEEYSKISSAAKEQIKKQYSDNCKSQVDVLAKIFCFTDESGNISIDDSMREQIENLYGEMYSKLEYIVEDKFEQTSNGYIVHISVSPMLIFEDSMNEINEFVNQYNSDIVSGKYNDQNKYSQSELNKIYQQGILNIIKKKLDDIKYGEPQEININVMRNSDKNSYYINADDLVKFSQIVIKRPS